MTLLQILSKAAGFPAERILALLVTAGTAAPDLKPQFDELIARLNAAIDQANLIALAEALPSEIAAIARGELHPKTHPSDAA
jgi:hypothetical protein